MSNPVDPFAPPPDRFPRNYSQFGQKPDDTHEIPVVAPKVPLSIRHNATPPPESRHFREPPPPRGRRKSAVAGIVIAGIFLGLIVGGGAAFLVTGGVFDDLVAADDDAESSQSDAETPQSEIPTPDNDESVAGIDTAPDMPTQLGAWWAREGVYAAKWEEPADSGGGAVTGYVVSECESGDELVNLTGDEYTEASAAADKSKGVFEVEFKTKDLTCVSVRAVNYVGAGTEATFEIEE